MYTFDTLFSFLKLQKTFYISIGKNSRKKFLISKNHDFAVTAVTFAFLFFKINKLSVLPQTNINGNVTASAVTSLFINGFFNL